MISARHILFIALSLAGIGIWSYNGFMLVGVMQPFEYAASGGRPLSVGEVAPIAEWADTTHNPYVGAFRDPFTPASAPLHPKLQAKGPAPRRALIQASPPDLTLLGILWNPADPIATVQGPDGKTENLHTGMSLADVTVTRIEPDAVLIRFSDHTFKLMISGLRP